MLRKHQCLLQVHQHYIFNEEIKNANNRKIKIGLIRNTKTVKFYYKAKLEAN